MSLEFVIIPINKNLQDVALEIKDKLINSIKLSLIVEIDNSYSNSMQNRISRWKKLDYDIITVDQEYIETNVIVIRFSDKGTKPQPMELEEFIDLVSSFQEDNEPTKNNSNNDNDTNNDNNNNINDTNNDNENNSGCLLM
jgi:threonyl-tRNA synthetase